MTLTPSRPLRADAARNREALLAAAADEFAEHGADASVADIARRAGVGKGTLFRHFPTKDDLISAIILHRLNGLSEAGERLLDRPDAGGALLEFLTVAGHSRQQRDVSFLHNLGETGTEVAQARARLFEIVHILVDRARDQGVVRADVTGADVVLLMCAPNHVAEYLPDASPDLWRRYLAIIFDGLRPAGAHPLPHPAPTVL
ncbi:TetR/AcrR family transcriptional regulator [Actinomadura terrae]|uniref:TetR/AcrR family transcriptional regulator n=1 Tax=Actinomadura terrae TaxID=604353 RepID=UPI001FA7C111|nr:TetR/AcrR family transcriptional regulator [Actinomadura terrae]